MTCGKLLWHKLTNRGMLTLEERKQGKEMKQVAEQMLHTKEGQNYNPIVAKMTEKQLAEFLIDLRRNMKLLRERKKQSSKILQTADNIKDRRRRLNK
jgi:hypothetical protein